MLNFLFSPLTKGIDLMKKGEYNQAAAYFRKLIDKNIKPQESYFNLGRCYFKLGIMEEAKHNLKKALDYGYSSVLAVNILEITNWRMISSSSNFNNWPSFSCDGYKIAYSSSRKCTNNDGKINSLDCGGIYVFNLITNEETRVVDDEFYNTQPKFSPDCRYLAYLSVRKKLPKSEIIDYRANPGLYVINLETGEETELVSDENKTKHYSFSVDGRSIVYSCWCLGMRNSGIFKVDIETKEIETIIPGEFENTFPTLSKDGSRVLFSSWRRDTNNDGLINIRDNSGIYVKDLSSGIESNIASDKYNNIFPSFSPDGSKVIYMSYRRDTNNDGVINSLDNPGIYVYDLRRKKEKCIVSDKYHNKFVSFSPDGSNVVFLSSWRRESKNTEKDYFESKGIYKLDLNKNKVTQIMSDKYYGSFFPIVSPTGKSVAYISWRKNSNRGLYIARLDSLPGKEELRSYIENNI